MKSKRHNLPAEEDEEATLVEPRFDEEAKETARPVVPLSQVTSADLYGRGRAGGPYARARYGRNGWPRSLVIMLAIVAVAAIVTAATLYRSSRRTEPTGAPQTVNETTIETQPETAESAPEAAPVERTQEASPDPSSPARENGTTASARSAREPEPRSEASARVEPEVRVRKDEDERRAKDEDRSIERARKDVSKQAKREEKDAEPVAEQQQQRDAEKRGEVRPRLVGIYTERRKP